MNDALLSLLAIPVRAARLVATMNEGSLVLIPVVAWVVVSARARGQNGIKWSAIGFVSYLLSAYLTMLALGLVIGAMRGMGLDQPQFLFGFVVGAIPIMVAIGGWFGCRAVKQRFLDGEPKSRPEVEPDELVRGSIETPFKARRIVQWVGWIFAAFGFLLVANSIQVGVHSPNRGGDVLFDFSFFLVPGVLLLVKKHQAAAVALLSGAVIIAGSLVFLSFDFIRRGIPDEVSVAPIFLMHLVFVSALMALSWRALKAAEALHSLRVHEAADLAATQPQG